VLIELSLFIYAAQKLLCQVYHSFHEEVKSYQQHWWLCDGPCQHKQPYYGYVRRAMNRAPSSRDPWWAEHLATCGGTYHKIKEPEGYSLRKALKEKPIAKVDAVRSKGKGYKKKLRRYF
jgi:hypothetical protein